MYQVNRQDRVIELKDVPQSCTGAPCPIVLADEHTLVLAYYVVAPNEPWYGKIVRMVGPESEGQPVALVRFHICLASMFGPPNDEAISGHPLSGRGLRPYSANVVEKSSWIRALEKMNSVHPRHRPDAFARYKHFIFGFHDSTFECVASGYEVHHRKGSLWSMVPEMQQLIASRT
jgi:hypothetical protein